jgi:hypothetical protein
MIVIKRNGRRTEITGWRAWLLQGMGALLAAVVVVAVLVLVFGIVFSLMTFLFFLVPCVIVFAVIAHVLQPNSKASD